MTKNTRRAVALALLVLVVHTVADAGWGGDDAAVMFESTDAEEEVLLQESPVGGVGGNIGQWGAAAVNYTKNYDQLPVEVYQKHDIPRKSFSGAVVTNEFCGGSKYYEEKSCSPEYEESMVMLAFPMAMLAIATLVIYLIVLIGRNCCTCFGPHRTGCCGGRYPSKGVCCGDLLDADQGYSHWDNKLFLFGVVIVLVMVVVGMAVGFTGNSQLSRSVHNLIDTTAAIPGKMRNRVIPLQTELSALQTLATQVNPYIQASMWTSMQDGLAQVLQGADDLDGQVGDNVKLLQGYEEQRSSYLYLGLWIPCVLSLLALFGYLCPNLIVVVVVPLVILTTVVVWIVIGVHIPVAVSTADFCVGLDYGLKHPNASSPLDALVGCHGTSGASKMANVTGYFTEAASQVACATLNNTMCGLPAVQYPDTHGNTQTFLPVTCPQIECNNETLPTFIEQTVVRDFQYGCATLNNGNIVTQSCQYTNKTEAQEQCLLQYGNTDTMPCVPGTSDAYRNFTLQQCNSTCLLNTTLTAASTVVGNNDLNVRFKKVDEEGLMPLVNCSFIKEQATEVEHTLCWDVLEAVDYVMAGLVIIGITFFLGGFLFLAAYKRFYRNYLQEHPNREDLGWPTERQNILTSMKISDESQPLLTGIETKQ